MPLVMFNYDWIRRLSFNGSENNSFYAYWSVSSSNDSNILIINWFERENMLRATTLFITLSLCTFCYFLMIQNNNQPSHKKLLWPMKLWCANSYQGWQSAPVWDKWDPKNICREKTDCNVIDLFIPQQLSLGKVNYFTLLSTLFRTSTGHLVRMQKMVWLGLWPNCESYSRVILRSFVLLSTCITLEILPLVFLLSVIDWTILHPLTKVRHSLTSFT